MEGRLQELTSLAGVPASAGLCSSGTSSLSSPLGLASDSVRNLYVVNNHHGAATLFALGGVGSVFATDLNGPTYLAIAPDNTPPTPPLILSRPAGELPMGSQRH
jgi:hypothetical protein